MTTQLIEAVKRFEGLRLNAYKCPAGVWTIGYGHTRTARGGMVITKERADELLRSDLRGAENGVKSVVKVPLTAGQLDALTDFAFNIGISRFVNSTLLLKINAKAPAASIKAEFGRWVYAGGKKLPGLIHRRAWDAAQWERK